MKNVIERYINLIITNCKKICEENGLENEIMKYIKVKKIYNNININRY